MKEIFGLTRADRDLLDELHRRFGTLRENAPSARLPIDVTDEPPQAPEVYIALSPPGGIPACEGPTGTGPPTFESGDLPGYINCGLYRIVNGAIYYTRQIKRIYNLSESIIPEGWITVKRDKYGTWFADTGAGTPCEDRNEVWMILMTTGVEGGTFDVTFEINEVEETLTIPAESTAAEIKTSFAEHSELATTDLNTEGGDLPTTSVRVEFVGDQAGKPIRLISFSGENLNNIPGTGTGTPATEAGLAVFVVRWQPGFTAP